MTIEALQKCKAFFSLGDLVLDNKTDKQLVAGTLSDLCSRCIRLSKNDYIFTAHQRKNNNTITLKLRFAVDDILHFTGLEYLPSIKSILNDNSKGKTRNSRKRALLKMIQKNKFSENNLQDEDITALNAPRSASTVPQTMEQYNIYYRINAILTLPQLLNSSEAAKDSYIFNGWDNRTSNIPADFVLSLPSPLHKDERIFLLGVKEPSNRNDCICVKIISVFPDLSAITRGKPKAYKVVSEDVVQSKKLQNIYTDEIHKKQLEAEKNTALSTNSQHMQINFNQGIIMSGGAAVIDTRGFAHSSNYRPPSFGEIIGKIKRNIKRFVSSLFGSQKEVQTKSNRSTTPEKQQSSSKVKVSSAKQHTSSKKKSITPQQHSDRRTQVLITDTKSVPQQAFSRQDRQEPFYPGRNAILSYKPSERQQKSAETKEKIAHKNHKDNSLE